MTYQSAPFITFMKYVFPIIFIGGGIFTIITFSSFADEKQINFLYAFGIALFWVSIFMVQMPFRLKSITVDEDAS